MDSIQSELNQIVSHITDNDPSQVNAESNLFALGLDRYRLFQLRKSIQKQYGVDISLEKFLVELINPSLIADFLKEQAQIATSDQSDKPVPPQKPTATAPATMPRDGGRLNGMTQEADRLTPSQQRFVTGFMARYNQRTRHSKRHADTHRPVHADRLTSLNFRPTLKEICYPIVADRSKGSRFIDIDGNEYVDLSMGNAVNLLGHNPDVVVQALEQQLEDGFIIAPQTPLAGEIAWLISEMIRVERVAFCNTRSEAMMFAVRIARAVSERDLCVQFSGAYHGNHDSVFPYPEGPGLTPAILAERVILPYNESAALEQIKVLGNKVAAVIVEPVLGCRPELPTTQFLKALRQITHDMETALVFDETLTGFRLHLGGAQSYFDIQADMVLYGDVIGGGMPVGILAGKGRYLDVVDGGVFQYQDDSAPDNKVTLFGGTFCKHPLMLAAMHAILQQYRKKGADLIGQLSDKTADLANRLNTIFSDLEAPVRLAHLGPLIQFEYGDTSFQDIPPLEMELFYKLLTEKGVYLSEKRIFSLSSAHTEADFEVVGQAARAAIEELRKGGFAFAG